jgi:hypothetical protein
MSSSLLGSGGSASPVPSDFSDFSVVSDTMDVPSVLKPLQVLAPQAMVGNLPRPPHPRWYIQDDNVEFMVRRLDLHSHVVGLNPEQAGGYTFKVPRYSFQRGSERFR